MNVTQVLLGTPGAKIALRDDELVTRDQLRDRVLHIDHLLAAVSGKRVLVWSPRPVDLVIGVLAAMRRNIAVPLPDDLDGNALSAFLAHVDPRIVLLTGSPDEVSARLRREAEHVVEVRDTARAGSSEAPHAHHGNALLVLSSGSTGLPRAATHDHAGLLTSLRASAGSLGLDARDRCLTHLPLHHIHGLVSGVLLPLVSGGTVALPGRFDPDRFAADVARHQPTWWSTTPTIHESMLRNLPSSGLEALRFLRVGAARLPMDLARRIERVHGVPLVEAWGSSETLQLTGTAPDDVIRGSVGRAVGAELAVLPPSGVPSPTGRGALLARGPTVARDARTPDRLVRSVDDGEDWFDIGDDGSIDRDGRVWLTGRRDETIVRGGENVDPAVVADALRRHPAVEDAFVLGLPHERLGTDVVAVVVPASATITGRDLRAAMSVELRSSWIPGRIVLVDDLPMTSSAKPDRQRIRELASRVPAPSEPWPHAGTPEAATVGGIIRDVLSLATVAPDDDLFALGASSLDLAQIAGRLGAATDRVVMPVVVVRRPTVRGLTDWLLASPPTAATTIHRHGPPPRPRGHRDGPLHSRPVIVLSAPRSGSTLLRVLLGGHPDLFAPPELRLWGHDGMRAWADHLDGPWQFFREGLLQALVGTGLQLAEAEATVDAWIEDDAATTSVIAWLQERVAPRLLVDKTPTTALDVATLTRLESLDPPPAYLHLSRDPADAIASFVDADMDEVWMHDGPAAPAALAEEVWRTCHANILDHLETVPRRRQHHVRFEELTADPVHHLAEICAHLGLEPDDDIADPRIRVASRMTQPLRPGSRPIGDPRFDATRRVTVAPSGRRGVANLPVADDRTTQVAVRLGHRTDPAWQKDLLLRQAFLLRRDWDLDDGWLHEIRPADAGATTLVWIAQQRREVQLLAANLGDVRVLGARSMHLLGRERRVVEDLARVYAAHIPTTGRIVLGGNCQGGRLALATADVLRQEGRAAEHVVVLDADRRRHSGERVTFVFGRDSHHNPRNSGHDATRWLRRLVPDHRIVEIPGEHGTYFTDAARVQDLADVVRTVL